METQLPAKEPPKLVKLTVNGKDITARLAKRVEQQGPGPESGTPPSALLFGATARNLSFDRPGSYAVSATVEVDGVARTMTNRYEVGAAPNPKAPGAARRVVFFLGDGMGLPLRTAARLMSKGVFEGRATSSRWRRWRCMGSA